MNRGFKRFSFHFQDPEGAALERETEFLGLVGLSNPAEMEEAAGRKRASSFSEKKVRKKMSERCPEDVRELSERCPKVVRKMSESCPPKREERKRAEKCQNRLVMMRTHESATE
jgi:hypothetical protein